MQFNNKQAIDLLEKLHAGGFPSAIVAGGCVRDEIFGKPVKDIDVFVSYADAYKYLFPESHFADCLERDVSLEYWSLYTDIPDVDSVCSVVPLAGELPVQIIIMKPRLSPIERLGLLDFGFCQVAWDGKEVVYTPEFQWDHYFDEITLVHCENQHEFDRSMVRYERLKQKYPEDEFSLDLTQFLQYTLPKAA